MPTYQYKCPECGHEFEEFQPITDEAIETCPSCGGKTRRLISGGAGLIFKGSGFYITDYRSESYIKSAKAESGKSSADKSGGGGGGGGGGNVGGSGGESKKSESKSKPSSKSAPAKSGGSPKKDGS